MGDASDELLNVYDGEGAVVGARPRREAKAAGERVGAVNVLIANPLGQVLLQLRPPDKENGGRWDKTVGGHVAAGETFDATAVREAGEELFDDAGSTRVRLCDPDAVRRAGEAELASGVLFYRSTVQLNLRDLRRAPDGAVRRVVYHVGIYLGRSALPASAFRPQPSEIDELRWFAAAEVDRLFLDGRLAPNMANLWLAHAWDLLELAGVPHADRVSDRT